MQKDVTVSKLSDLQKRILVYARKQMLAKGQKIKPRDDVTVCFPAPPWLDEALTKSLGRIFEVRKRHFGALDGDADKLDYHDWKWFFEEASFVERTIKQAAEDSQVSVNDGVHFTRLYKLAVSDTFALAVMDALGWKWSYAPWPYYDCGWYFCISIKGRSADEVMQHFTEHMGEEKVKTSGLWLNTRPDIPVNCTIPEMLRDLFDFPIREDGHVSGLAFSPSKIGEARYNRTQAALRRACSRLAERGLIIRWWGQRRGLSVSSYERSRVGLTERGLIVADVLIDKEETRQAA